jgi:hypothetical protein
MMTDDKTAKIAKRAMLAFVVTLGLGVLLAHWLVPGAGGAVAPLSRAIRSTPSVLQGWVEPIGRLATAILLAAICFTLLMLWNFLFQVANPDSIIRRELDGREPESPLPHADQLPLEGD